MQFWANWNCDILARVIPRTVKIAILPVLVLCETTTSRAKNWCGGRSRSDIPVDKIIAFFLIIGQSYWHHKSQIFKNFKY